MGQQSNIPNSLATNSNWKEVKSDGKNIFHNINPYAKRIFQNIITKEYLEQYQIQFVSERDYLCFEQELQMRRDANSIFESDEQPAKRNLKNLPYIYKIKGMLNISSQNICTAMTRILLYAEKVDLRLKQINDIPFPDQLYLTQATLQGFKALYQNVGYFDIIEEMIFINRKGIVKVWMNPNLANNRPCMMAKSQKRHQKGGSQSQMIINLLNLIEENTDSQSNKYIHFKIFLQNRGTFQRLSFYKALQQFKNYLLENRLSVPKYMASIKELYEDDDNQQVSMVQRSQVIRISIDRAPSYIGKGSFASNTIKKGQSPKNIVYNKPLYDSKSSESSYKSSVTNQNNPILVNPAPQQSKKSMALYNQNRKQTPAFRSQSLYYSHLAVSHNQSQKLLRQGSPPQIHLNSPVNRNVSEMGKFKSKLLSRPPPLIIPNFIKKSEPQIHEHLGSSTTIKFNYGTSVVEQRDNIRKMETPQFKMLNGFASSKTNSENDTEHLYELKPLKKSSIFNYYSANEMHQLDPQIAQDLNNFIQCNYP